MDIATMPLPSTSTRAARRSVFKRRKTNNPDELQGALNKVQESFNALNGIIAKRAHERDEDECDMFGKMLAKKLRKLPEHEREIFMYDIDGMFINRIHLNNP